MPQFDVFSAVDAPRQAMIDAAMADKRTGFIAADHVWQAPVYLVDGQCVDRETFILTSGLDHLLPGASIVKCSQCEREASPAQWHQRCGMSMPDGATCSGVFF